MHTRTHLHAHTHRKTPPNARPSSPHTRQPVSVNQLNHLRPENNPMTDSPSGLPLSAQAAWKADSQGTGCTGCWRQELMLARAWWRWAFSKSGNISGHCKWNIAESDKSQTLPEEKNEVKGKLCFPRKLRLSTFKGSIPWACWVHATYQKQYYNWAEQVSLIKVFRLEPNYLVGRAEWAVPAWEGLFLLPQQKKINSDKTSQGTFTGTFKPKFNPSWGLFCYDFICF